MKYNTDQSDEYRNLCDD